MKHKNKTERDILQFLVSHKKKTWKLEICFATTLPQIKPKRKKKTRRKSRKNYQMKIVCHSWKSPEMSTHFSCRSASCWICFRFHSFFTHSCFSGLFTLFQFNFRRKLGFYWILIFSSFPTVLRSSIRSRCIVSSFQMFLRFSFFVLFFSSIVI